ncbi:hypothetical protein, conserved [Leishmania donovani]|uniref:Phospholipid/glycerol acyltransferase domain-containing protein n=1 Tax=Leishmania donovani TaxID=5661 RepID=E9B9U1_LEIDO|nr:hypothetical protein, conserved [Leishmania donovani]TPP41893.1 hypothetical protein CGC21_18300 [Leishmania donovani]CBZ32014.1 hypothetical protein, conserved [Leishmania donovani]
MEKFRHFGDAATGIHPFTFVMAPTAAGRIGSICMFPARLLLSAVFALLLLVTDTLLWLFYVAYLGLLGRLLLAPLQRAWLRGLLFSIGNILPQQPAAMVKPQQQGREASGSSRAARAGDLVVCNLQSVWDALVLEVMLAQPYHAICFPDATMAGEDGSASSAEAAAAPGLRVFWPGPTQRWRVWAYTRRTSSLAFLRAQQPDSAEQQAIRKKTEVTELPLYRVQKAAALSGVPVWWFGEGTCSNGRGLLLMPAVTCASAVPSDASAGCVVHLATIQYDSPAMQNVLGSDNESFFAALFRTGLLLYGSTAPAWTSPLFPTAEVTYRSTRLARATPSTATDSKSAASRCHWTLSAPALLELRNAMCQRGQALVVSGSVAGVRRQPVSVGVKEKKGFIEAYRAMLDSKKASPSA